MRRISAVLAALALIVLRRPPAAAAKPEKVPDVIGDPVVYPAGEICGFDLEYRVDIDTGKSIVFPPTSDRQQRGIVSGHIVATITNLENHRSGTWNISGPGTSGTGRPWNRRPRHLALLQLRGRRRRAGHVGGHGS